VKIKARSQDAGMLQEDGWPQMAGWLAELRDDDRAGPPGRGHAAGDGADDPRPAVLAPAGARAGARGPVQAAAGAQACAARAEAAGRAGAIERAVIGDQLRMPIIWCQMGSCISRYSDPAAFGEADTRARAIGAGWRVDALGRLACRRCQQTDPCFWASRPVVLWDRHTAIARATRAAAVPGDGAFGSADWAGSGDPGRLAGTAAVLAVPVPADPMIQDRAEALSANSSTQVPRPALLRSPRD
jgi:hypothetical protein